MSEALLSSLSTRCRFPPRGTPVVCAVSGGADSLALLALATHHGLDVIAVHVDHGLRAGSAAEADVVAAAAARFGAEVRREQAVVAAGPNLEARARQARWSVLPDDAMTGHTADDQAETMLINLLRGAGVRGLGGIRPGRNHPLLELRRAETWELCDALRLDPVRDPSNDDSRFVRNRLRHEALPLLADISDRDPVPLLVRTAEHARQVADGLDEAAAGVDPTDVAELRAASRIVADAALRGWLVDPDGRAPSSAALQRVWSVIANEAVACEISGGRRVSRSGGRLQIVG